MQILKLLEVCEVYQPKTIPKKDLVEDGKYFVYGANGKIGRFNEYNHSEEEVLLGCRGSVGSLNISEPFSWITGNAMVVKPKSNQLLKKYVYYFLLSLNKKNIVTGSSIPQITRKSLETVEIPVPPLQEQEKIVEKMDKVFETTNTISSINEKKNGLFDHLNKSFYEGLFENMKIFPSVELIEVCKLITDGSHFSPKEFSNEYPYITVKDIDNYGNIDFVNCKKIDKELFLKMKNNNCNPLFGDILFSKDGTIGKTSLIDGEDEFVVLSSLAIIRPDQTKINKNFLFNLISSPKFIELCVAKKTGVAIQRIILKNLKTVILPVPPLEIQEELSKKIDKFKKYLKILENNLNSIDIKKEEFKKSILKKEFSYE